MTKKDTVKVFEDSKIRTVWDSDHEKWYISIVDVVSVLTESANPQVYWRVLKKRLLAEGNQTVTNCNGLKKENLRDNMTNTELILNMLAEASTKDISQAVEPKNFSENKKVAKQGGNVAGVARKELEKKTGKKVISTINAKNILGEKNKK